MTEEEKYNARVIKPSPHLTTKSLDTLPTFFNGLPGHTNNDAAFFATAVTELNLPDHCTGLRVAAVVCKFGFMDSRIMVREYKVKNLNDMGDHNIIIRQSEVPMSSEPGDPLRAPLNSIP
mmetsp:Transcript_29605/g.45124  ORF Transcript_29605/g.45124 Transcript_29605/m.45124 type:complete len:120 (+) Transcript_29605:716-1075(+)